VPLGEDVERRLTLLTKYGLDEVDGLLIAAPNNRTMALQVPGQEAVHLIKPFNRLA
jgi:hypothetical protein